MSSWVRRTPWGRSLAGGFASIGLLLLPLLLFDRFWLLLAATAAAAAIGSIGLMLLFGKAGQLSIGHPFFLGVGAYSYIYLAGTDNEKFSGMSLSPGLSMALAIALSGIAGFLFSPVSGRLKNLSLGLATIALIFIGQWLLDTFPALSGGYNGREVPPMTLAGISITHAGLRFDLIGIPFFREHVLWTISAVSLLLVILLTKNLVKSRIGRAFEAIRDSEIHAMVLGINVDRYRSLAFTISSAYAGLAGVILVIIFQHVEPSYWNLNMALQYFAMIIIGGMYSVHGAVVGAAIVTFLINALEHLSYSLGWVGSYDLSGIDPGVLAAMIYGLCVIAILLFEPRGVVSLIVRACNPLLRSSGSHEWVMTMGPSEALPSGEEGARSRTASRSLAGGDLSSTSAGRVRSNLFPNR